MNRDRLKQIEEQIRVLQAEQREIQKIKEEEKKIEARKNIGRCFKRGGKYLMVVNINQQDSFNEYQYPAVKFEYPYDGHEHNEYEEVFQVESQFSATWGKGTDLTGAYQYTEIDKEEFFERMDEVYQEWIRDLKEISKDAVNQGWDYRNKKKDDEDVHVEFKL